MKTFLLPQSFIALLPAAMRSLIAISLFAILAAPVAAQPGPLLPDVMVQQFCQASQVASGAEFDAITAVALRLAEASPHIHVAVIDSPLVNAWDVNLSAGVSLICIPVGLVQYMGGAEGELAFILGHEIGHATDKHCKSLKGRLRVAPLATLLGEISGDRTGDQRACEARADELGVNLMTCAGYDPNDAAVALRRLSRKSGVSISGPTALGDDHPITADRVHHIRKLIARAASRDRTATCRGS
jgi:Zn-dependent protease with chaperone function